MDKTGIFDLIFCFFFLQILLAKPHCVYSIIGITSFGKACGFKNVPAVYTNVANYTSWIEEVVWN